MARRLAARFGAVARTPDKGRELRRAGVFRLAGQEVDIGRALMQWKPAQRARSPGLTAKLRLFRIFKWFGPLKDDAPGVDFRPLADRLERLRWARRL
jgi:hypothetical protein